MGDRASWGPAHVTSAHVAFSHVASAHILGHGLPWVSSD